MKKKRQTCLLACAALLGLVMAGCEKNPKPNALALVGARVIESEGFLKRYEDFRRRTGRGVPDHLEARRQVLQNYIDEELLITEAQRRGYAEDAAGQHEQERIRMQELLNAFNRENIAEKVRVREEELKRLYLRLNTRVKARHLYAPTRAQADSLYRALHHGATFEALAATTFKDPVLRNSGGLLGYFTVDEMEPSFEEAAYTLALGEISKPVRTIDGYSIIRVEARHTKPLLTETDYLQHREKLHDYWFRRKAEAAAQAFTDSMRNALRLEFNEATLAPLFVRLQDDARRKIFMENQNETDELADQEFVRSTEGVWDVAAFRVAARFTSEKQQDWIRNEEQFQDFIAGLLIRAHVLKQARAAKLDQRREYQEKVEEKFDLYLLERMEDALYAEVEVPEDSVRAYFDQEPERFASPPQVHLREIVLRDSVLAEKLAQRLKRGASFADLAQQHSVRRATAEQGGDLGFLTPQDLGKWSSLAFGLKPGERRGPVQMDSMFVLLECVAQKPLRMRSFEEVRTEVQEAVRQMRLSEERRAFIARLRQSVAVTTYADRLKSLRSN